MWTIITGGLGSDLLVFVWLVAWGCLVRRRQRDRVVKVMDQKSIGLCPQGFESPRCRYMFLCCVLIEIPPPGLEPGSLG